MLVINADDFGRSVSETDAALRCYRSARLTSVSAMVFMDDSERATDLASQTELDVGLHLNFTDRFTGKKKSDKLGEYNGRLATYLRRNKYSQLFYNPLLRKAFSYSYQAQAEEFERLYGRPPSHINGHHHMHLCANLLLSDMIPAGTKIRRNFSFWPGEKNWLNRSYRCVVDCWLARRYRLADYFFDLTQSIRDNKVDRVVALAATSKVELMTHPVVESESNYLMSDQFQAMLEHLNVGSYALV